MIGLPVGMVGLVTVASTMRLGLSARPLGGGGVLSPATQWRTGTASEAHCPGRPEGPSPTGDRAATLDSE